MTNCPVCGASGANCTGASGPSHSRPVDEMEGIAEVAMKEATPRGGAAAFVSDEDIYVNAKNEVVGADSPDRQTLVAKKGVPISRERARAFGLIEDDVSRATKKAAEDAKARAEADQAAATSTADRTEIIVGRTATPVAKSATPAEDKAATAPSGAGGTTGTSTAGTPAATTTPSSPSSSDAARDAPKG